MAKKKTRRPRARKGVSTSWGRSEESRIEYSPCKIVIPSGRCPVELAGHDFNSVKDWVIDLTTEKPPPHTYAPSVYAYWIRAFYDFSSPEYREVEVHLSRIVKNDIKKVGDLESDEPTSVLPR